MLHLRRALGLVGIVAFGVGGPLWVNTASARPNKPSDNEQLIVFRSTSDTFVGEGEEAIWDILAVHPDGSGLQRLTDDRADDSFPAVSPDGSTVAFDSTRDGVSKQIYAMTLATGEVRALTSASVGDENDSPAWSPNGKRIAFMSSRDAGTEWTLSVMNADGTHVVDVARVHSDSALRPTWSPDGKKLAFASTVKPTGGDLHIFVVKVDGSGRHQITRGNGEYEPAWSPTDGKIAYFAKEAVWVMDADGSGARRVATGNLAAFQPSWSPDGTRIAYVNEAPGHTDIKVVGADGGRPRAVTNASGNSGDETPSWGRGGATDIPAVVPGADAAVEIDGSYDVVRTPIPGTCSGFEECDAIQPLSFEMLITQSPDTGYAVSVGGNEAPLVQEGGEYVAAGDLAPELVTSTCDGQLAQTRFELRLTAGASARNTARGPLRAKELGGSYSETNPAFGGCGAASISYAVTATRFAA